MNASNPVVLRALSAVTQTLGTDRTSASLAELSAIVNETLPEQPQSESGVSTTISNLDNIPAAQREEVRKRIEKTIAEVEAKNKASMKAVPAGSPDWASSIKRFVAGYSAYQKGDYPAALEVFNRNRFASNFMEAYEASVAGLPYHAYAAAKAGKAEEFRQFLEAISKESPQNAERGYTSPAYPEFERHLAFAILAGLGGDTSASQRELLLARGAFPDVGRAGRPLVPEYVFAEVCEQLGTDTGRSEYIEQAVSWAKAWQVYDPSAAWAYAVEARHGKDELARARAAAVTSYLDRKSARLTDLPPDVIAKAKAKAWLDSKQAFPRGLGAGVLIGQADGRQKPALKSEK